MAVEIILFDSDLGWMALAIRGDCVDSIKFGYASELQLLKAFDGDFEVRKPSARERSWISRLKEFSTGQNVDLSSIPICLACQSGFQARVLANCRTIPYGRVMTYGQLAAAAGSPRAARAVGTTMRKNRFPLVVPCHRVIASNGIGGYSAPGGAKLKSRLLAIEGVVH